MDMDSCFNEYVMGESKELMKRLIEHYNTMLDLGSKDDVYRAFMMVLSNCPQGIELFMRCSTNYEQLATIYRQRRHHKLKEDWGAFCKFVESLPFARELILVGLEDDKD
jgi:hypothetical protein